MAPPWKGGLPKGIEGSNPSLSAKIRNQKKRTKWGRAFGATPFRLQNVISISGGRGEIRTPGEVSPTHAFQACPLDHSGTLPL